MKVTASLVFALCLIFYSVIGVVGFLVGSLTILLIDLLRYLASKNSDPCLSSGN